MRLSSILLGVAVLAASVSANDPDNELDPDDEVADDEARPTTFNGQTVPPLLELGPDNWDKEVKASKWLLVKHYSPWCPHCIDFAPTFQTLYEYYYTSTPSGSGNGAVDFTAFYDFRFAMINCIAYNDLCTAHGIASWPTVTLYKDGEEAQKVEGAKSMSKLSVIVEDALENTKPGTRPATLDLPKPGDKFSPDKAKAAADTAKAATAAEKPPNSKTDSKPSSQQRPLGKDKPVDKVQPAKDGSRPELIVAPGTPDKTNTNPQAPVGQAKSSPPPPKGAGKPNAGEMVATRAATAAATAPTAAAAAPIKDTTSVKSNAPPEPYRAPPKKMPQIAPDTNPQGASVSLNAETFQSRVTMTRDPWFIKFYAPWCHHCQAMAATWEQLAKSMKGKLNIGEVNCDAETRLCKDVALRGYPTIVFFRGPERIEYDGLRGLGDFVQFSEKAIDIGGGVQDVDAASLKELEEKEEVIFVYFYDHATTSEDFVALERLPLSLIGHAKLVKTQDPALYDRFKISTWPRLLVSREGRPTYYTPLTPNDMRNTQQVLGWMKSVWLPIVPELTASNAHEIMDGKIVVLGILNREDQNGFHSAKREMKSAANEWMDKQIQLFQLERQEMRDAKQLRIEEAEDSNDQRALRAAKSIRINMDKTDRKEVAFAWVDGHFWHRWVRTTYGIDIKDGEKVIINDEDARRYWDQTITGNAIVPSRTSILETLNKVTASPPKIKPRLTISGFEKALFETRMIFSEHPLLTLGCVLGLGLGLGSWLRGRVRRTRGGHFRLEENGPQHKAPLIGIDTDGKVD